MINVISLWVVLGSVLVGWGLALLWLVRRIGGGAFSGAATVFQTLWLGYAGLLAFLQLLSVVAPIADLALVLSLPPALAGFALQRRAVARRLRGLRRRPRIVAATLAAVIVVWFVVDY